MADEETRTGLVSLRALGRALAAGAAAWCGIMVVTEDPLGAWLVPLFLGGAAIFLGISVFRLDAKPKARWRGTGASAAAMGLLVVLVRFGLFSG